MALERSLKVAAVALCLLPASFQAHAISRYTSTAMSCPAIQQKISVEGAAIFRWTQKPDISRYGRYVAGNGYCDPGERAEWTRIPAKGTPSCPVLECKHYDPCDDPFMRLMNPKAC